MTTRAPSPRAFDAAPWWTMALLVLSAEAIFALPFHVARFFRPTLLQVFDISHTELGLYQSAYGFFALLAYFPGGLLADRFSPRILLPGALLSTAAGGLYFATLPSSGGLMALHMFWGVTTILLFWGALIRATRDSATGDQQGRAFGFLDGGRGLLAAGLASLGVYFLGIEAQESMNPEHRAAALRKIILAYSAVTAGLGVAVYVLLSRVSWAVAEGKETAAPLLSRALRWARQPRLIWHSVIVLCAYCTYKGIDFYSVFAAEVHGMNEVEAAAVSTLSVWVRPFAALGAGILAERISATRLTFWSFVGLVFAYLPVALAPQTVGPPLFLFAMVLATSVLVYAFRALYFVLVAEGGVPETGTGTAVGIVSFLGFSPDFFFPALSGWMLDRAPGAEGYGALFLMLTGWALLGAVAARFLQVSPVLSTGSRDARSSLSTGSRDARSRW